MWVLVVTVAGCFKATSHANQLDRPDHARQTCHGDAFDICFLLPLSRAGVRKERAAQEEDAREGLDRLCPEHQSACWKRGWRPLNYLGDGQI